MRRTLIELLHLLVGLAIAAALARGVAWSYPLGAEVAWWCGAGAMLATLLMSVGPIRRAWVADHSAQGSRA